MLFSFYCILLTKLCQSTDNVYHSKSTTIICTWIVTQRLAKSVAWHVNDILLHSKKYM